MSLTSFRERADVKAKLKALRPGPLRKIAASLKVEPRSQRYMLVGSAFDYLLRFELQRRAPHAVARCWTAESAPDLIWQKTDRFEGGLTLSRDDQGQIIVGRDPQAGTLDPMERVELARDMAGRVRKVIETAKSAHSAYLKIAAPARSVKADLAGHAIRLAKVEGLIWCCGMGGGRRFDSTFEEAAVEDVEDLLALLAIVPFDALLHDTTLMLNPVFNEASVLVGGADADLISGDTLLDFKTTKSDKMAANYLDQLLGYFLLARRQHQADPTFPAINRLAIYFARHGYLWTWAASTWTEHPQFAETEEWFFARAKEVFKAQTAARPVEITWSGVKIDPADMKLTIGELIRRGRLRVQTPPPS